MFVSALLSIVLCFGMLGGVTAAFAASSYSDTFPLNDSTGKRYGTISASITKTKLTGSTSFGGNAKDLYVYGLAARTDMATSNLRNTQYNEDHQTNKTNGRASITITADSGKTFYSGVVAHYVKTDSNAEYDLTDTVDPS